MQYDLHMHSRHSFDSTLDVGEMLARARRVGLDGVAITDHDSIEGSREARSIAPPGLVVIPGVEFSTDAGHILAYFVDEVPSEPLKDPLALVAWVHAKGGMAVLAHPFAHGQMSISKELVRALDGMEGYNARYPGSHVAGIEYGEREIRAFAEEYGKVLTAGSDAHAYGDIGKGRLVVPAGSAEEAREAMSRGNTVVARPRRGPIGDLIERLKEWWR